MRKVLFFFLIIQTSFVLVGLANTNSIRKNTSFDDKNHGSLERVYVHTDKDIYFAGDRIFYKIYLNHNRELSSELVSKVAYLSVTDSLGLPLLNFEIQLKDNDAYGSFVLPDTLNSGVYSLQSWTNNIIIAQSDAFYKPFLIINRFEDDNINLINTNSPSNEDELLASASNSYDVASRTKNLGVLAVSRLQSNSDDVASRTGKSYWSKSKDGLFSLYFQATNESSNKAKVEMRGRKLVLSLLKPYQGRYLVTILKNGKQVFADYIDVDLAPEIDIDPYKLPQGLLILSVYNEQDSVINSLSWLNEGPDKVRIVTPKDLYQTREKVEVSFDTSYLDDKIASASISVSREETLMLNTVNIKSLEDNRLVPLSDENFDLNFSISNARIIPSELHQLGAIKTADNQNDMLVVPENYGSVISGRVLSAETRQPVKGATVILSAIDRNTNLKQFTSQSDGSFFFLLDDYHGGKDLYISVFSKQKDLNYRILMRNKFWVSSFAKIPFISSPTIYEYIEEACFIRTVNRGFNIDLYDKIMHSTSNTRPPLLYGVPSHVIKVEDYVKFTNIVELANEIVPNLRLSIEGGEYSAKVVNSANKSIFSGEPTFFLNGVHLNNLKYLENLSSENIERVEVHSVPWVYGNLEFSGVVSLFTFSNSYDYFPEPDYLFIESDSEHDYVIPAQPIYKYSDTEVGSKPDFRETLVWDPNGENIDFSKPYSFYTSDLKGTYTIVLEGITSSGETFNSKHKFKVR